MAFDIFQKKNSFVHAQNSGVEKRIIFEDEKDLKRFIETLEYYKLNIPPSRFAFRKRNKQERETNSSALVEIIAFCLMPNHFHLLLKENAPGNVSKYLSRVSNSYTKYFNSRHKRSGSLFKGRFKSAKVEDELLTDVARFIHLDPVAKKIVRDINHFPFSSYFDFTNSKKGICEPEILLSQFSGLNDFIRFNTDFEDYKKSLMKISKLTIDK